MNNTTIRNLVLHVFVQWLEYKGILEEYTNRVDRFNTDNTALRTSLYPFNSFTWSDGDRCAPNGERWSVLHQEWREIQSRVYEHISE